MGSTGRSSFGSAGGSSNWQQHVQLMAGDGCGAERKAYGAWGPGPKIFNINFGTATGELVMGSTSWNLKLE